MFIKNFSTLSILCADLNYIFHILGNNLKYFS
jgi:hypothetical protein